MAADFRRIDAEVLEMRSQLGNRSSSPETETDTFAGDSPPLSPRRDEKTWVVFWGKAPGIYDNLHSAAVQAQGFSDGFWRSYSNQASAQTAWTAYTRDGIFPDYGRGPWIVVLGRKPGVFEKVSELEASVKGYPGAIFRSCSSVVDANIKFQLFSQEVTKMFTGPGKDLFSGVGGLLALPAPASNGPQEVPAIPSITATPIALSYPQPQVAESSKAALKRASGGSSFTSSKCCTKLPPTGDGWYVAYNAVLPGVYCGSNALKEAGPKPGGFRCAVDEESANSLFHNLAINDMVIWAGKEE